MLSESYATNNIFVLWSVEAAPVMLPGYEESLLFFPQIFRLVSKFF